MLVKMGGFGPASGGTLVYFGCEDCSVPAARAAENGGSIVKDKMSIGEHGHIAPARDSEGNVIGFHSMHGTEAPPSPCLDEVLHHARLV